MSAVWMRGAVGVRSRWLSRAAGRSLEQAELVLGETQPAVGDVLVLGPAWQAGMYAAIRVERVRGAVVWFEYVSIRRDPLGGSRWEFLPPAGRRGPERLRRR